VRAAEDAGRDARVPETLFVYGTLLDPKTRRAVIGRPCHTRAATLAGYARREGHYPYLEADPAARTAGLLVLGLSRAELARLDDYEGVAPSLIEGAVRRLYARAAVEVICADGRPTRCWVYHANLAEWPPSWR
jgi:gamma-glutamylcyclotransferase (GGCT)/AIG2-like uncharacterized protein YtfP